MAPRETDRWRRALVAAGWVLALTALAAVVRFELREPLADLPEAEQRKVQEDFQAMRLAVKRMAEAGKPLTAPADLAEAIDPFSPSDPWGHPYDLVVLDVKGRRFLRIATLGQDEAKGGIGRNADLSELIPVAGR